MFGTVSANCTVVPDAVPSDAGIAGAGVLLSSTITASLAIILSASLIIQDSLRPAQSPSVIRRKLLSGYSDQQIIVGIGIQSVGLVKAASLVPYHFFLIWMLSLLSMATHNATLLTLVHDFRRDWVLRWLRQVLMFVNLGLSCVYGVFVLQSKIRGLPNTLPIGCAWVLDKEASSVGGLDYVGTIVVIAGNCVVFGLATWYLHSRQQRFYRAIQMIGLVLMAAIAIGAIARAYLLSQAFGSPDVALSDQGEKSWSFGQLLSMLMLFLPVVSVIEIMRGEIAVAPPVEDDEKPFFETRLVDNPRVINQV
ncbi:hypothetical protein B0H67DRAFT_265660 [Lasiosphaeris hirsuta]|uniref:Uncharacterized protein n=1 Tax=Lasiosphaeris hirsuta TaxID=260670 RepID=A0AA40DP37_9PEZI|nr:hypothetical protein B0H67DRAFT_265660 [Lasiosphaeris hirsuta]